MRGRIKSRPEPPKPEPYEGYIMSGPPPKTPPYWDDDLQMTVYPTNTPPVEAPKKKKKLFGRRAKVIEDPCLWYGVEIMDVDTALCIKCERSRWRGDKLPLCRKLIGSSTDMVIG